MKYSLPHFLHFLFAPIIFAHIFCVFYLPPEEHNTAVLMLEHRPSLSALAHLKPESLFKEESAWSDRSRRGLNTYRNQLAQLNIVMPEFTSKVHFVWAWLAAYYAGLMRAAYRNGHSVYNPVQPGGVLVKMVRAWWSAGY